MISQDKKISPKHQIVKANEAIENSDENETTKTLESHLLDIIGTGVSKHYRSHERSHSDCTGLVQSINDIRIEPLAKVVDFLPTIECNKNKSDNDGCLKQTVPTSGNHNEKFTLICPQHRLSAKIINTAINCDGQFAVYAIQVTVIEDNQQKSWHVYRRYSRFLDLKKVLVKRV